MQQGEMTLTDYFDILRRRKWSLVLPAVFVFMAAGAVAFLLPSVYRSSATILIEDQEIPLEMVQATVTSFVEQRLQQINQRIMSSTRLLEIVNRFDLYRDLRQKWTTEEVIGKMREDTKLDTISVETVDKRTGRPMVATIAFTLSYEGKDAATVQKVANVLTSLFLEENLKVRERQAVETSEFLDDEMQRVKRDLAAIEEKIARFKERHIHELPELMNVNLQTLNNIEQSIQRLEETLRGLKEREGFLETQLASIPQEKEKPDRMRLEELQVQLVHMESRFSELHPDVVKTRAEIERLEQKIKAERGDLSIELSAAPENPVYITTSSQLASTRVEIESVSKQIEQLRAESEKYRKRIMAAPNVEQEYNGLFLERSNTQTQFNELMQKLMEARVSQGLEQDQKGERFILIDPARLPEKPFKPNRLAILLIGVVLGIGAGVGTAALKEFSDHSVRNPEALTRATHLPVLASIPLIVTREDIARRRFRKAAWGLGAVVAICVGIVIFHYFVMDLDIFWAKFFRKIDRTMIF